MIGLVLAAAGAGRRFGSQVPKQFLPLQGEPVYLHSLRTFVPLCQAAVVVVPEWFLSKVEGEVAELPGAEKILVCPGGSQRQDSVGLGLQALPAHAELVLVHDAARPHCPSDLVRRVIEGARQQGACIPALRVSDTVKEVKEGLVVGTLDRSRLVRVQTPQCFRRDILVEAFRKAAGEGFVGTDESSLVERLGQAVKVVEGEACNRKITWKEDL